MAKTIPIHKKGPRKDIENYRPIANLCSASKFFEKLILKRITEIADDNNVDITNTRQHGYKKLCYRLSWYMHVPIYMYLLGEKKIEDVQRLSIVCAHTSACTRTFKH